MPEYLAQDLAILHEKHRDTTSLAALLDLVLDGHLTEEQEAIVYDLWQREARTMLRLAAGSKTRLRTLEDMVLMEGDDLEAGKELFAQLQRLGRHPDRRVAKAARTLLAMSKRDFAREGSKDVSAEASLRQKR
jgi:hypothetical protein